MIKYYLAENNFSKEQDDFIAHVVDSKVYDMESVVDYMISMGAAGTKGDILNVLSNFNEALAHIIKDGSSVNLPFLKTNFSISGIFNGALDGFDHSRHEVHINTPTARPIKALARNIKVHKVEPSTIVPHILEVVDGMSGSINDLITSGGMLSVQGKHLKVEGESTEIGIFFENLQDNTKHKVSVISINRPSQLIFMTPTLNAGKYQLKIVTQYRSAHRKTKFTNTTRERIFDKILTVS